MDFRFKRIGFDVPKSLEPTDYLGDCRLIFPFGDKVSAGRFFGSWNGELYLSIRIEPESESGSNRKSLQRGGLCIEVGHDLKVTDTLSLNLKPGILELNEFLRLVQTSKVRGTQELEWRKRANLLRKIGQDSDWLKVGVYQIITYDGFIPPSERHLPPATGEFTDAQMPVRTPDFASGGISAAERVAFSQLMVPYRNHASRTTKIDPDELNNAVDSCYNIWDIMPPRVVVLPNPLSAAIAGGFAAVMLFRDKFGITANDSPKRVQSGLITKFVEATLDRAFRASANLMDESTLDAVFQVAGGDRQVAFADDALRILSNPVALDPDWSIDFHAIANAINSVLPKRVEFKTFSNRKRPINWQLKIMARQLSDGDSSLRDHLLAAVRGNLLLNASINSTVLFCRNILKLQLPIYDHFAEWEELVLQGAAFVMHEDFCFVSEFPKHLQVDEQNRFHSETGPALVWRDGWSVYYWHGTPVTRAIIESPETITVTSIHACRNQELRRVMIARYGMGRFLIDNHAKAIHSDQCGTLYRMWLPDDEPLNVVRVINSTAEPDGTFREYFLRVPPTVLTAREGIAWTFGLSAHEYEPDVES